MSPRLPAQLFGRRVDPEMARTLGVNTDEHCRQVVAVTGMGGLNNPAFAQQTHIEVLRDAGLVVLFSCDGAHHFPAPLL